MGEQYVVEGRKHYKPLVTLPRYPGKNEDESLREPVVSIDVRFGKKAAGCVVCNVPIPAETFRVEFNILLREPVSMGNRQRTHERYYAHPGCLTERARPEVLRSRMDCYDCGAEPPRHEEAGRGLVYWADHCFTVSKFAPAALCPGCKTKARWKQCDACLVYFPHWMISEVAAARDVPAAHLSQYADLAIRPAQNMCEFCAQRLGVPTVADVVADKAKYDRLRAEIAEHGIWDAGDD